MGDEEGEVKLYAYAGARAAGEVVPVTAGEEPKVLTKDVELLGPREGEGEATFPTGDTYKGSFAGGYRSGDGVYTYAAPPPEEGADPLPPLGAYEGKWAEGKKAGVGTVTFASGAKYHGTFADGKYEGHGTMFYANGDIYTGDWVGGLKQGSGTYIFKESGAKISGSWAANVLQVGTFTDKWGNAYEGSFASDATQAKWVGGGSFSLASGAVEVLPKPTKAELLAEVAAFDADGNGFIDASELKALLTRPGAGTVAMSDEEAAVFMMLFTELFDKNVDGKLSVAEMAAALESQL